jgi:hypothetical protein
LLTTQDQRGDSVDDAIAAVDGWNDGNHPLMSLEHTAAAWQRLGETGWLRQKP